MAHCYRQEPFLCLWLGFFFLTGLDGQMLGYVKIFAWHNRQETIGRCYKKYIKDLEELNTQKESVLAILSHDLRSPLSAIIGTAKYLKENFRKMKSDAV